VGPSDLDNENESEIESNTGKSIRTKFKKNKHSKSVAPNHMFSENKLP
jgi:hypothetical protein